MLELLIGRIATPVRAVQWESDGMPAGAGADFFTASPATAAAELEELSERLAAGLRRLGVERLLTPTE